MEIKPISNVTFGIYKNCTVTKYGPKLHGEYKGYNIDVYTDSRSGKIFYKLYYVSDCFLNFVKSKLAYFSNNKKWKQVYSGKQ